MVTLTDNLIGELESYHLRVELHIDQSKFFEFESIIIVVDGGHD